MKKTLTFILVMCICVLCLPMFVACDGEEDKYWLDTDEKFNAFVTTELVKYQNGYELGTEIEENITNGYATFGELKTIYEPVFKLSISFVSDYKDCFKVAPFNQTGDVKKAFGNLNQKIDKLNQKLSSFETSQVAEFKERVKPGNPEDILSLQALKEFKREYINLATEAIYLAEDVLNLYIMAYQDIPQLYENGQYKELSETEIGNYTRLALSKSIIYTLLPTINYINSFNGVYIMHANDEYLNNLNNFMNLFKTNKVVNATAQTLYQFTYTLEVYMNDVEVFNAALESIDMPTLAGEDYEFDCFKYSNGNPENYANATKVLMFAQDSIKVVYDKLDNLYQ